jgi:hypothetical protein
MEKMMIFGLAFLFTLMTAIPPKPVQMPPKPVPADGLNYTVRVTPNEPQAIGDNAKPVKVNVKAENWHDPR